MKNVNITIRETGTDISRSTALLTLYSDSKKSWKKTARNIANVLWVINIIFTLAIGVLAIITDSLLAMFSYIISAVIYIVIYVWVKKSNKNSKSNQIDNMLKIRMEDYADGFHSISYNFGEEDITVDNKFSTSSLSYRSISSVVEFADGLWIMKNPLYGKGIWLPARFISKSSASDLINLLKEKVGRKYHKSSELFTPETAEVIQPDAKIVPKGEKKMTLVTKPSKGKSIFSSIMFMLNHAKKQVLLLILLLIALSTAGFFREIVSFIKLVFKVIGLVKNYMETGILGSNSEIAQTAMSLLITVVGFMTMIVIIILIAIVSANIISAVVNYIKSVKEVNPISEKEQTVEIYDDVIVCTTALGDYSTPWSNISRAVRKTDTVHIYDNRQRYMTVSIDDNAEQKTELFDLLSERLGKSWHKPQLKITQPKSEKKTDFDAPDYDAGDL